MTRRQELTTSQAAVVKWRLQQIEHGATDTDEQIAVDYGVSVKTIRRIARGYIYAHVRALPPQEAKTG